LQKLKSNAFFFVFVNFLFLDAVGVGDGAIRDAWRYA
jgi:hypothetical protein